MVESRSKQVFKTWLADRPKAWRDTVYLVAVDGFTGFKTATIEESPDAATVMDPFHVVRLAGDALDGCRRRIQHTLHGHRGRVSDPLYRARPTLHTGVELLTAKQQARLNALFTGDGHVELEAIWGVYQEEMTSAYREPATGRTRMEQLIANTSARVPRPCEKPSPLVEPSRSNPPPSWHTSTDPTPRTGPPKRSMAGWNTSAAPPSASRTSPAA